jgi:predicted acetyltransferase
MHDLAEFRDLQVQPNGRFRDDRLRTYLSYDEHWPLVLRSDREIVGFALVRKSQPETFVIGEFFIKPEFRRAGIGKLAVPQILKIFAGNWEIPFQIENSRAATFWREIVKDLGYEVSETSKAVFGNPELPHDVWLSFPTSKTQ